MLHVSGRFIPCNQASRKVPSNIQYFTDTPPAHPGFQIGFRPIQALADLIMSGISNPKVPSSNHYDGLLCPSVRTAGMERGC